MPTWQHPEYNNSRGLQCQRHNLVRPQSEQHQRNTHQYTIQQQVHPKQHRTIHSHHTPGTLSHILPRHNLLFSNTRSKYHMANSTHTSLWPPSNHNNNTHTPHTHTKPDNTHKVQKSKLAIIHGANRTSIAQFNSVITNADRAHIPRGNRKHYNPNFTPEKGRLIKERVRLKFNSTLPLTHAITMRLQYLNNDNSDRIYEQKTQNWRAFITTLNHKQALVNFARHWNPLHNQTQGSQHHTQQLVPATASQHTKHKRTSSSTTMQTLATWNPYNQTDA